MISLLKKGSLALSVLVLVCNFVTGGAQGGQNQPFKNLQVLKGMTSDQVFLLMGNYNLALGQNCDFCHDMAAPEKGDKPQHKKALQMIKMTRDINATVKGKYNISVDCMSCHQGKTKPTTMPDVLHVDPPTPPNPDTQATPPTKVVYQSKLGNVQFPHDTHMVIDCTKCHHTGEMSKCDVCHLHGQKPGPVTRVVFYTLAHTSKGDRACIGCHAQSKGPTVCTGCHKK